MKFFTEPLGIRVTSKNGGGCAHCTSTPERRLIQDRLFLSKFCRGWSSMRTGLAFGSTLKLHLEGGDASGYDLQRITEIKMARGLIAYVLGSTASILPPRGTHDVRGPAELSQCRSQAAHLYAPRERNQGRRHPQHVGGSNGHYDWCLAGYGQDL